MARYLNTSEDTRYGAGVGLEVGNTIYFDVSPPQFCYWNTTDARRAMLQCLIHSGHVDCLHSFGTRATSRGDAGRALEELHRHNCHLKVWVDHGGVPSNFGPDIMRGRGDLVGSDAYHADLTTSYGIQYVWRGRVTSVIGQDLAWSVKGLYGRNHPLASGVTILKEMTKRISTSERYAMNRANQIVREANLRSGQRVWEFLRSNPHWGGIGHGGAADDLPGVLRPEVLNRLVERGGVAILYTHLGKTSDPGRMFSRETRACLESLSRYQAEGKLLVTTTRRLLDYCWLVRHVKIDSRREDAVCRISISTETPPVDLSGLSVYVPDSPEVEMFVNNQRISILKRNNTDHTGRRSVSIPWRRLLFPPSSEVPG